MMCNENGCKHLPTEPISEDELCKLLKRDKILKKAGYYQIDTDFKAEFLWRRKDFDKHIINARRFWYRVYLENNPKKDFYTEHIENGGFKIKHFKHGGHIHRGHYIAKMFMKYLIPEEYRDKPKVFQYFGKGNSKNIYYQSDQANINSKSKKGQLYFENKVNDYLRKNTGNSDSKGVIYEVKDIRTGCKKKVSLGRRILVIFLENGECVKDHYVEGYHVFIPNWRE